MNWIKFLRKYGPIARNDNMYDETILRSSRRMKIEPICFEHPFHKKVLSCFSQETAEPVSVILTGTAGDGKTHLCRQVWKVLKGNDDDWASNNPYLSTSFNHHKNSSPITIHLIRDLSGWAPQQEREWEPEKAALLHKLCESLFDHNSSDIFLIAANDGQLIESFRRLDNTPAVIKARECFEDFLVEEKQQREGIRLRFFNLSQGSSSELFKLAIDAFLNHPGWQEYLSQTHGDNEAFGPFCPIRYNYELLKTPLVQHRLISIFNLCDHNGLHIPLRQILLLLANAVLGHPDVKDRLMVPKDVPKIIAEGTTSKASLYNNIFGGNLSEVRRQGITIFEYFDRFQIGYETSNRIDNLLLYGDSDPSLQAYYERIVSDDRFYGADKRFQAAKNEYIEGIDENDNASKEFLELLISQRRGLFFKIPEDAEKKLKLWELTVFKFAGEYLSDVTEILHNGAPVKHPILERLVNGLNRIFTGMLVNNKHDIIMATSGDYSQAKISRILVDRISVRPRKGECVELNFDKDKDRVILTVHLSSEIVECLEMTLIRYEFLSRIALDGALPASFSKECYEDILAFKSQLLAALNRREQANTNKPIVHNDLIILSVSDQGLAEEVFVEVIP